MKNSFKKINSVFEVVEHEDKLIYTIQKQEEKITIYDKRLMTQFIEKKFNDEYKKILYIIMDLNSSDDSTETDEFLVRNKIDELKANILNKYSKYIDKNLLNKFLKMIIILESKINIKERGRGR